MKRTHRRLTPSRATSFTLVELLVVISIIIILAAIGLRVGQTVIQSALRAKANAMAQNLNTSVMNYYAEYGVYPIPTTAVNNQDIPASASAATWQSVIFALCGGINPYNGTTQTLTTPSNTRGIMFFSPNKADLDSNGIPKNPTKSTTTAYYNLSMDGDYDGLLKTMPDFSAGTAPPASTATITAGSAVWIDCNLSTNKPNINFYVKTY